MTTTKQAAANKINAQSSTGPTSPEGKAVVARNATKVGVFSRSPVVDGLEDAADWESFRDGVVEDLQAVGTLETTLARRVADALWRLQRVSKFEAATVARNHHHWSDTVTLDDTILIGRLADDGEAAKKARVRVENANERLANWDKNLATFIAFSDGDPFREIDGYAFVLWLQELAIQVMPGVKGFDDTGFLWNDEFLEPLSPPACPEDDPRGTMAKDAWRRPGWTCEHALMAVAKVMSKGDMNLKDAIVARTEALRKRIENAEAGHEDAAERSVAHYRRVTEGFTAPNDAEVARITRWEAHLSRQMSVAMAELHKIQARRGEEVGQQVNVSALPSAGKRSQEVIVRVQIEQAPPREEWRQADLFAASAAGSDDAAETTKEHNGHGGEVPDALARRGAILQNKANSTSGSQS